MLITGGFIMMDDERKGIRIISSGPEEIRIRYLAEGEREKLESAIMAGHAWITVKDGRIVTSPTRAELPTPAQDEEMLPFWRKLDTRRASCQQYLLDPDRRSDIEHRSPYITITSLCGYYYTPLRYSEEAAKLEGYGFVCMRSRRGDDGRYWEIWYLPGLWAAKGALKEFVEEMSEYSERTKLETAIDFLRTNSSFGSLEVSVQRLAMVID